MRPTLLMKRKLLLFAAIVIIGLIGLIYRVFYIQAFEAGELQRKAFEQQTRDRLLTPRRGVITDRNGALFAANETVCAVSVIRAQIKDTEMTARVLSDKLGMDYETVLKKVSRRVALERVAVKVDKQIADEIRALALPGVAVDEDVLRVYPFGSVAASVIGFVGRDNQGVIGIEAKYDALLKGESGKILTYTDAKGQLVKGGLEERIAPTDGATLVTTIDAVIQQYAEQTISKAVEAKEAKRGLIIAMNPKNGEILAIANEPSFDLNDPFTLSDSYLKRNDSPGGEEMAELNKMWRDFAINDTYEPGSTFKIVTSAAGLEEGVVTENSPFNCGGSYFVAGRTIKCWRSPRSHGSETFVEGVQNSCNPVFIQVAERLGTETFHEYLVNFGMQRKTGIDLPGEATGIMHKLENIGPVELATMSFGQSFQITPLQLLTAGAAIVNGGKLITPHVGLGTREDNGWIEPFDYGEGERVISQDISDRMRKILESVVEVGTGNKTYIPGYRVGGKTATSEKLPRHSGKYIASFLAFAPADDPRIIALVLIDEPQGAYYGGQVAGPVMKEFLENALPYIGVEPDYNAKEIEKGLVPAVVLPDLTGLTEKEALKSLESLKLEAAFEGGGDTVSGQYPPPGETVNKGQRITIYINGKNY